MKLKDSGTRRDFGTGAVRDAGEGKGRCDLIPLDIAFLITGDSELDLIELFKQTKDPTHLVRAIKQFTINNRYGAYDLLLEVSKHFEDGAAKYGDNNWQMGIPLHCYIDSGVRHFLKFSKGDKDEPHDRAFVWNLMCAIWTSVHKPEMDDILKDIAPKT